MIAKYAESKGRKMRIVNLDSYAGTLVYDQPIADVRDVIDIKEVKEADRLNPGTAAGFEHTLRYYTHQAIMLDDSNSFLAWIDVYLKYEF
jgi:hypothetical protein